MSEPSTNPRFRASTAATPAATAHDVVLLAETIVLISLVLSLSLSLVILLLLVVVVDGGLQGEERILLQRDRE